MCSFPHFSLACFDILSLNFAYDFVSLYYRPSSSVVNLPQCLWELCPLWNLEDWKYTVFRTFLLHALTYWAEILHMILFHRTTDQVLVPSICVNVCGSYAPLELRILEILSFPHFSLACFDILNLNFAYDFVLSYYRSSSSVINLRQCLWELWPFWNLEYWKYTVFALFSCMLWHIELKFCIWFCFTVLQIKFECRQFASISIRVMPLLELKVMKYTVFRTFLLHALTYWPEILHMTIV